MLEELSGSKKKPDRQVMETLDGILVELTARIEKQERSRKVRLPILLSCASGRVSVDGFRVAS